jgi:NADPH:quinone reductase-like Zn-dependent oxidoreductase
MNFGAEIPLKAIRIHAHELRYEDAPDPHPASATDVLVKIAAASINDMRTRGGGARCARSFPHIPGTDGAGTVMEAGAQVKHLQPGSRVCLYPASGCGQCEFCASGRDYMCEKMTLRGERENGTYAEYVSVPARDCFALSPALPFEDAAALPFTYLTMWRMLVTQADIKPGEYVLVLGDGSAAAAALQLAVQIGGCVLVSSRNENAMIVAESLGIDRVIDYHGPDFVREVRSATAKRGVDILVDCVGGETWLKSLAALAKGGRLVTCAEADARSQTDVRRIFWNHLKIFGSTLGSREEFQQVLNFFQATRTRPIIDRIFPFSEAALAQKYVEEAKPFGKVVLRVES